MDLVATFRGGRRTQLASYDEAIASYVTAGARLHLYGYLDKLKENALYCDTESVIFVQPEDDSALVQTGDWMGAMTSELKPGEFIC